MSLKAFHVVFVSTCVLFCVGLACWSLWQWRAAADGGLGWLLYGMGWLAAGIGLMVYGRIVLKKLKGISYL
jgi:4-amino-4-deoxy-L-arabinose transferase-like glycosyltransferase